MKVQKLTLPSLRGSFGDWIYYACLMPMSELGSRVEYATQIHSEEALSKLIQRALEGPRAGHIAHYLSSTPDRFFSSLVLATYGGTPKWLELGNFRATSHAAAVSEITQSAKDSIGFLQLSGKERIFAIDGQHRLAGVKRALADPGQKALGDETVPVLLVGHKDDPAGLKRTRRLFTTLNKTAIPVKKSDIIALDEDDVMAITARRLVEENAAFKPPKIAVIASSNLPASNQESLTTITNLYDILKLIFMHEEGLQSDRELRFNRPSDQKLQRLYETATSYFDALSVTFPPVRKLFKAKDAAKVVPSHRNANGGHLLFRPVGLEIMTRTVIAYAKAHDFTLAKSIAALAAMPTDLSKAPYRGVIWNPTKKKVVLGGKTVARKLMLHIAGLDTDATKLLREYRAFLEVPADDMSLKLPAQLKP